LRALISTSDRHAGWGLLALRLITGVVMLLAGWMKLFDFGVGAFAKALAAEGVPLPELFAWGVTLLEVVGGAFLIIGLLSKPLALLLAIDMVMAILLVSHETGFLSKDGKSGMELNLLLIGGFLAILFSGPGSISVDRLLEGGRRTEPQPVGTQ
jgi:putative oxidoreductase